MILLSLLFFEWRYISKTRRHRLAKRLLLWVPCVAMLVFTLVLALEKHFAPRNTAVFYIYLFIEAYAVIPTFCYVVCSAVGHWLSKRLRWQHHYGGVLGCLAVLALWTVITLGITTGFTSLRSRHITYASASLPQAFDGYRIVHFSDLHVGSYGQSRRHFVESLVDSINAQQADIIIFTGDLINLHPEELPPYMATLSRLNAKDGVISILGNHDYADYLDFEQAEKDSINNEIIRLEEAMGWRVLENESAVVERQGDSIVLAGTENIYKGSNDRCISRGDIAKTMQGVSIGDFVIMLQHTPKSWRTDILPQTHAQLTLSGDTHGMQLGFCGWSPIALVNSEWGGLIHEGERAISVSTGVGGFVPFRFGMPPEFVVITLKKK